MSNLEVTATGNVSGAVGGLKQLNAELEKTQVAGDKVGNVFGNIGNLAEQFAIKNKAAGEAMAKVAINTKAASEAYSGYGVKVKQSIDLTNTAGLQLTKLGESAKTAAGGLAGIGAELAGGLITAGIGLAIAGLSKLADTLFGLTSAEKAFNDSLSAGSAGFVKATAEVNQLRGESDLLHRGFGSGDEFLKNYNDTLGKVVGTTNDLHEAERRLAEFGDDYIKFMFLQSVANAAFKKSAEAAIASLSFKRGDNGSDFVSDAFRKAGKEADATSKDFLNVAKNAQTLMAVLKQSFPTLSDGIGIDALKDGIIKVEKEAATKKIKIPVELTPKFLGTPDLKVDDRFLTDFQKKFQEALEKAKPPTDQAGNTITIAILPKFQVSPQTTKQLDDFLKNIALEERFAQLNEKIGGLIENTLATSLGNIGELIGKALGSGADPIAAAFEAILGTITSGLKAIGQAMIEFGIAKTILSKLRAIPGPTLIIAGIALELAAGLLEGAFAKSTKGFALGGSNIGGGFYDVGERGKERVFLPQGSSVMNNAQLNATSGSNVNVTVYGEISGQTILLASQRAARQNGLNN